MRVMYTCVVLVFLLSAGVYAQDKGDDSSEVIKVSEGYSIIVPKGSEVKQVDGQIIIEDPALVLSRKIEELNGRIKAIEEGDKNGKETELEEIKNELKLLVERINSIEERLNRNENSQALLQESVNALQVSIGNIHSDKSVNILNTLKVNNDENGH